MVQRNNVFISYSHRDKPWLDRLHVHLRPLERQPHKVVIWSDRNIRPGSKWREELEQALASARVAVLLISADFLSSDFITENELPPLLRASESEGAVILPLILKPCRFVRTDGLNRFQAVNDPRTQPLSKLPESDQEEILDRLAEEIENILARPTSQPTSASQTSPLKSTPIPNVVARKQSELFAIERPIASSSFNPNYLFETFVEGNANQFAFAAARAVANNPAQSYNPLFIYGGVGLGKTHLLHAIGHEIQRSRPELNVLYLSAEQFVNELIEAVHFELMTAFQERYRKIDVLMIDDVQFLSNRERVQEEFYHTFNTLYTSRKQIILSSDSSPRSIPTLEERLRSRFEWGLIADIHLPDLETKIAILQRKASLANVLLPFEVCDFIAGQVKSNIRELEGFLNRVLAHSSFTGKPVSLALAREALREILPEENRKIRPIEIIKLVARHFDLKAVEITSRSNIRQIVAPRQVAMYLCKKFTDCTYPDIAKIFGNRHHSTVMYSVEVVQKKRDSDPEFDQVLRSLEAGLTE